jgi:PAS domain S-box-containing protein
MSSTKILIVEDEWLVAQGIKESLAGLGYEVVGMAVNGGGTLQLVAEQQPDLVLLDILLQGDMDGIAVADHLRRQFEIPVVFLTAYADPATLARAKEVEPFGYILKPFEVQELHSAIEIALYKTRSEKRLQHLNRVLRAIHNVNHLIVTEKDRRRLIQRACQLLAEGRGYFTAWIALLDDQNRITASAVAGETSNPEQIMQVLSRGELPPCGSRALEQNGLVVVESLSDYCTECIGARGYKDRGALVTRLSHQEVCFGLLGVQIPVALTRDEEEFSLFRELAADLSLALYKMDQITEHEETEKALRDSEALFRAIFEEAPIGISFRDHEGRFIAGNPAMEKMLGYTREEYRRNDRGFPIMDYTRQFHPLYQELAHGRRHNFIMENRAFHKNGYPVWGRVHVSKVKGKADNSWFALSLIENITREKQTQAEITGYQERLRALAAELTTIEERERRRLASDLHDNIGQVLALLQIKLGYLRRELPSRQMASDLDEARNLLSQIISVTRSLTLEVGLSVLHELGFESGVEWLGKKFQEQYGLQVEVNCEPLPPSLGQAQITFLFRAVRELLTNVTKHAQAKHVRIEIKTEGASFMVRVADDGIGFEVSNLTEVAGFGLFSIAERVSNQGGKIEVTSAPDQGTMVAITFSLLEWP